MLRPFCVPCRGALHKMVCEGSLPGKDGIGMINYLILCRSLTYAQRSASALGRAGIPAHIMRCPKGLATEGCSHCVKINSRVLERALETLLNTGLRPERIFGSDGAGRFEEVAFM